MNLNNIFVTTIDRTKIQREKNLAKIATFGQKYFNINVAYGGVDGSSLTNEEIQSYLSQGIIKRSHAGTMSLDNMIYMPQFVKERYMSSSEIGVFLSHLSYWNFMVQNNIRCALILEDDAYFDDRLLAEQIKSILCDYEKMNFKLVSLFKHDDQKKEKKYKEFNNKYHRIDARCWGTVAYIITLDGAKELLNKSLPIRSPVDFSMFSIFETCNEGFIIKDSIVTLADNFSSIRDNNNDVILIEKESTTVKLNPIPIPKHIFTVNNPNIEHPDYILKNIYHDFSKSTVDELTKDIMNGIFMPMIKNCDMSLQNKNKIIYSKMLQRHLSCDEISDYMSHYKIWKEMIEEKIPYAIILGKTIAINKNNFDNEIKRITANAPFGFTTISLEKHCDEKINIPLKDCPNFFLSSNSRYPGYIISLLGAIHFVKKLSMIENTIELALKIVESEKKTGYIYKCNIMKTKPIIKELKHSKRNLKIKDLFYLREFATDSDDSILNLKPNFFEIDEQNISVKNLINMNNGIINTELLENGNIMFKHKNRPLTNEELREYLSHVTIWSTMIDRNIKAALIVSNKAKFVNSNEKLEQLINCAPHRTNVLLFINDPENPLKCNDFFYHCHGNNESKILAYIITLKGAKDLLRVHKPIVGTIDNLIQTYALFNKVGYISKETFFI